MSIPKYLSNSELKTNLSGLNSDRLIQQVVDVINNSTCTCSKHSNYTVTTLQTAQIIFSRVVTPVVCGFGIISNLLNFIVLSHRKLNQSPYTYLQLLAVADFCVLFLTFFYNTVSQGSGNKSYFWKIYDSKIFFPVVNIFVTSSIWLTMVLTIDRFRFVRYPFHAKTLCKRSYAILKSAIVFFASSLENLPKFFMFYVELDSSGDCYTTQLSTFFSNTESLIIRWFHILLVNAIPLVTLTVINFYLVYAVHQAQKLRRCMQAKGRQSSSVMDQQRMTVTLISITFLFIICTTMSAFVNQVIAVAFYGGPQTVKTPLFKFLRAFSNFLMTVNHSMNFVMYCAFNRKFCRVFRMTIHRWCSVFGKFSRSKSDTIEHI
ncbi:G-protein coupled receptor [Octopus vulgaris]|uniref:G-protein coupled receptor n=2 Tax=Octopus TaxID=6643 RepID=A0AA36AGU0_OCTVU|nr:probable G-protein coupled receptor B0563.6 [Octopus sinensis]CAI9715274.1 G-protein coupled receptor [Octopus vulgaris]